MLITASTYNTRTLLFHNCCLITSFSQIWQCSISVIRGGRIYIVCSRCIAIQGICMSLLAYGVLGNWQRNRKASSTGHLSAAVVGNGDTMPETSATASNANCSRCSRFRSDSLRTGSSELWPGASRIKRIRTWKVQVSPN